MENLKKYNNAFMECFDLPEDKLNSDLVYMSVEQWDSVGHMQLVAMLEDAYDIMMDTEDIVDFSSYDKGKEILGKYGVTF